MQSLASEQVAALMPIFFLASAEQCRASVPKCWKVNLTPLLAYMVSGTNDIHISFEQFELY